MWLKQWNTDFNPIVRSCIEIQYWRPKLLFEITRGVGDNTTMREFQQMLIYPRIYRKQFLLKEMAVQLFCFSRIRKFYHISLGTLQKSILGTPLLTVAVMVVILKVDLKMSRSKRNHRFDDLCFVHWNRQKIADLKYYFNRIVFY